MTAQMRKTCEAGMRVAAEWLARLDYLKDMAKVSPQFQPMVDDLEKKIYHTQLMCETGQRAPVQG